MKEVTLQLTQKQLKRYHIIQNSLDGKLTVLEAAKVLGISERQVIRQRNGVREEGAAFLVHKNRGRPPSHAVPEEEKKEIVELYCGEMYRGANFKHYSELLAEHENIDRSRSTVHRVLKGAKIESPKKRRRFKPHRSRKRKAQEGLLIQIDASPFEWFGGRVKYALHGGIDDATGNFVGAYITKNECLLGYYEVMRQVVVRDGIPVSTYSDRSAIFKSQELGRLTVQEQLDGKVANDTQFGRAMKELGVTMIYARSAQAKGRIERLWETLQSRLVIEFRIRKINNVHDANAFLLEYIPKFNNQFAVEAELAEKAYVPNTLDLDLILCVKEKRVADKGGVFSFNNKLWKIVTEGLPGSKVNIEVIASATKGLTALYKGKELDVIPYVKPKKVEKQQEHKKRGGRYTEHAIYKTVLYSSDLADSEIRSMLEEIFLSKYA